MGYLNMPDKTEEALDAEGWLHSGDLGKHDEKGFLFITGRIKGNESQGVESLHGLRSPKLIGCQCLMTELIITAGGENIPPVPIEDAVKEAVPLISNAMLIGDKRKFLSMLLTIKVELRGRRRAFDPELDRSVSD